MTNVKSVIFAGYRSWAKELFELLSLKYDNINWYLARNEKQLSDLMQINTIDFVVLAGWSWILEDEKVNSKIVLGLHPSDLPDYAGGSPIQNQVLDGIKETKMSLFKLSAGIDTGDILLKESMSLQGGIEDIFSELVRASEKLLDLAIEKYPNFTYYKQKGHGKKCRRLPPSRSEITIQDFKENSLEKMYDIIRCREDPYPNVFIEDKSGKLFFNKVSFVKNEKY